MDGFYEFPQVCGSDTTIVYDSNGNWHLFGRHGTWRLDGEVLTETMTGFDPLHDEGPPEDVGKPLVSTLRWVDRNTFVKRRSAGDELAFRRCPEMD